MGMDTHILQILSYVCIIQLSNVFLQNNDVWKKLEQYTVKYHNLDWKKNKLSETEI